MIKKIKRLYKRFKAKIDKSPVRYMVIGYLLLWLCLCLVLTVCLGRRHMESAAQEKGTLLGNVFQDIMREFEEEAHKPDFHFEDNKDFLNYKLLMLRDRLDSIPCSEEPYGLFQVQLRDLSRVDVWLRTDQPEAESTIVDLKDADRVALAVYSNKAEQGKRPEWDWDWYTCPVEYYENVFAEIEKLEAEGMVVSDNPQSRLEELLTTVEVKHSSLHWYVFDLGEDSSTGYPPITEEIYMNDDHEFIPKSVKIWYKKKGDVFYQPKIVNCYDGDIPEGYRYADTLEEQKVISATVFPDYPKDRFQTVKETELIQRGSDDYCECLAETYWDRLVYALYLDIDDSSRFTMDLMQPNWIQGRKPNEKSGMFGSWYTDVIVPDCTISVGSNSIGYFVHFDGSSSDSPRHGIRKPFSFFQGDVFLNYYNVVKNSYTGERIQVIVSCVLPGALSADARHFLICMIPVYLGILLFFAFLAWINYRRIYSAQAKSGFYKSLVNSMAHDLKSPLMVMQGYCENLKENVHTEKKDYYADQVLSNIQYLNTLMDKNLYHSRKRETLSTDSSGNAPTILLSDLVKDAIERSHELLQTKNIPVYFSGETYLTGDRETLSLVVENLIGNAAKYSRENEPIEVTGMDYAFIVSNTAELSYGKKLQQLLNPLEMGDESRTAGKGTGLGLSIVNGIMQGYGGRIKLSYDKETKRFSCLVKIGRARKKRK